MASTLPDTSTRSIKLSKEHIDLNQIAVASIEASAPLGRDKGIKLDVQLETGGSWLSSNGEPILPA